MDGNGGTGGGRSEGGGDLRAFVLGAWESPGEWHRAPPGRRWEFRFLPRDRLSGEVEFEIRDDETGAGLRRYRRAGRGKAPVLVRGEPQRRDGSSSADFPEDWEAFVGDVSGVLDEWPDLRLAGGLTAAAALVELLRRYLSTLESDELSFKQRFRVACAGTGTFSFALGVSMALDYSALRQSIIAVFPPDIPLPPLIIFWGILFVSVFPFAFLCSWQSRVNGPLRLYAISYLFPYAVWSISKTMDVSRGSGILP